LVIAVSGVGSSFRDESLREFVSALHYQRNTNVQWKKTTDYYEHGLSLIRSLKSVRKLTAGFWQPEPLYFRVLG
jgi:hypothetical protein